MKLRLANLLPISLSIFFIIVFLWIELTPPGKSIMRDKFNDIIVSLDYTRYTVKSSYLVGKIKLNKNTNNIIVINIQDKKIISDIDKLSNKYETIGAIIRKLIKGNPRVIVSDIIITHPLMAIAKDVEAILQKNVLSDPEIRKTLTTHDDNFKDLIVKNNLILPILETNEFIEYGSLPEPILKLKKHNFPLHQIQGYIANYTALQSSVRYIGFTNISTNNDYSNADNPLLVKNNLGVYPSLALAIAMRLFPERKIKLDATQIGNKAYLRKIQFGTQIIPTGSKGDLYTPFNTGIFEPKYISAKDLLSDKFDLSVLNNAIIFLNTNLDPVNVDFDILQTRYNINAQISLLNSILSKIYLYTPYWTQLLNLYLIIAFGVIITLSFNTLRTGTALSISIFIFVCLAVTNISVFYYKHIVLNISSLILLSFLLISINMIFSWLFEAHKKIYIRKFFAQYVPPAYLNLLLDNPNAYGFEGKSEELTVLFADIRNFTGISEHLDASGVKSLLNKIFTPLTSVILKNGGTVDKYVGDMVMAFFGAPIANPSHRESALNCALEMLAYTRKMHKTFTAQGLPPVELSIGLNTGIMNVGDMGSEFRRSYTVIGDAVNLGSRIQSITSYYGVKLLVGSSTCKDQIKFVFRMIDKVKLKGKTTCETIYEVVGRKKSTRDYVLQEIQEHQKALDAYFDKNWDLAIFLFSVLADKFPTYKVYSIFLERSQNYKLHNPPEDWDGAYTFTEK